MSWREILGAEKPEIESQGKHPQYPQNPTQPGNSEDCEDIEDTESEFTSSSQSESVQKTPTRWPQGSALVVAPGWWPGQSFLVVKTEGERDAFIEEGESPGIVWTLPEARKLNDLKAEEKLNLARIKVEFAGQIGRVRPARPADAQEAPSPPKREKSLSPPPKPPNTQGWQKELFASGPPRAASRK